jgi:hypothetical protein
MELPLVGGVVLTVCVTTGPTVSFGLGIYHSMCSLRGCDNGATGTMI